MAGEDEMAQVKVTHLRGASGYLLIADGCRKASLTKAIELRNRIEEHLGALPFLLVINKADLKDQWEVQPSDVEELRDQGWSAVEASAKTGDAVEEVFVTLARRMIAADASRAPADDDDE
jgi:signal recognition particle receptor subunit beta